MRHNQNTLLHQKKMFGKKCAGPVVPPKPPPQNHLHTKHFIYDNTPSTIIAKKEGKRNPHLEKKIGKYAMLEANLKQKHERSDYRR